MLINYKYRATSTRLQQWHTCLLIPEENWHIDRKNFDSSVLCFISTLLLCLPTHTPATPAHLQHLHRHLSDRGQASRDADANGGRLGHAGLRVLHGLLPQLLPPLLLLELLPHQLLPQQDAWRHGQRGFGGPMLLRRTGLRGETRDVRWVHRDGEDARKARRDRGGKNLKRQERENREGMGRSDEEGEVKQIGEKVEGRQKEERVNIWMTEEPEIWEKVCPLWKVFSPYWFR